MSALLLDERPLQVLPFLAKAIGIHEALFLQQLHWLLREPRNGKEIDGKKWIFNTVDEWIEFYFPFMTRRSFERMLNNLETNKFVESIKPEGGKSRRKYYRIMDGARERLDHAAKLAGSMPPKRRVPKTKTSLQRLPLSEKESSVPLASSENTMDIKSHRKTSIPLKTPSAPPEAEPPSASAPPREIQWAPSQSELSSFVCEHCPEVAEFRSDILLKKDWEGIANWREWVLKLNARIERDRASNKHIH